MATAFDVSPAFLDGELVDFIVAGRLHAKIDKVSGVIETNRCARGGRRRMRQGHAGLGGLGLGGRPGSWGKPGSKGSQEAPCEHGIEWDGRRARRCCGGAWDRINAAGALVDSVLLIVHIPVKTMMKVAVRVGLRRTCGAFLREPPTRGLEPPPPQPPTLASPSSDCSPRTHMHWVLFDLG